MMQAKDDAPDQGASCGMRLRQARENARLSLEDVSGQLKMPVAVVCALENDDWERQGAPVFVRGHLRSYAKLLGIDIEDEIARSEIAAVIPPELVSHSHTPRYQRVLEQVTRRAVYIVVTAAIAVPVWQATRPHLSNNMIVESLDLPGTSTAGRAAPDPRRQPNQRTPLIASIASITPTSEPPLTLHFTGDSWVQVFAADGTSVEQGLLAAGEKRSYPKGTIGRVVLGNSAAVEVRQGGSPVSLEPFSRANVARFTLSSDGSLAPVTD